MEIAKELQERIFQDSSYFLEELHNRVYGSGETIQKAFMNILFEEVAKKFPQCKMVVSLRFKSMTPQTIKRPVDKLGESLAVLRGEICRDYQDYPCEQDKCFEVGHNKGSEIDALFIYDNNICLLEYQSKARICYDFMKMYWMLEWLEKPVESIFVTGSLTTMRSENTTTFQKFNQYMDAIKPALDKLLPNWKVLEIVNLSMSQKNRQLYWKPEKPG